MNKILAILLLFASNGFSQPQQDWIRRYPAPGGDSIGVLNDVFATVDGGFAMAGHAGIAGNSSQIWFLETDRDGVVIRESLYPPNMEDPRCRGYSIIQDDNGGFMVGGSITSGGNSTRFAVTHINSDGQFDWWTQWGSGECFAVIELKSGDFLACGIGSLGNGAAAQVVKFNIEGETIWVQRFQQFLQFFAVREIDGGAMLVGHTGGTTLVCRIGEDGELIDYQNHGDGILRSLISCPGGFAASGGRTGNLFITLRLDSDGNLVWRNEVEARNAAAGVARMPDGGFSICGGVLEGHHLIRIDRAGNFMWRRDDRLNRFEFSPGWQSILTNEDGFAFVVGMIDNRVGVLMKLQPDISAPRIAEFHPIATQFAVLLNDSVEFEVEANDIQGDSLWYRWSRNRAEFDEGDWTTIAFDTLGIDTIICTVFDSTGSDQATWHITVTDLFISDYTPDTLNLTLRRGVSVDFSLDTLRYVGEQEPEYIWTKTNLNNGQVEETGGDARCTVEFPWSGEYTVEGKAYRGESSDQVTWNVAVRGAIWAYVPEALAFDVEPDSLVHFEIVPSEPENESLSIQWLVDGEFVREGELGMEWRFAGSADGSADLNRHYLVQVVVADSVESDTVTWSVTVRDLAVPQNDPSAAPPRSAAILSVSPNPFNSTLTIRFSESPHAIAGGVGGVSLRIYDLSGRLVADLLGSTGVSAGHGKHPAAEGGATGHSAIWNASSVPAGVYLVRLQSGSDVSTQKVVLMR